MNTNNVEKKDADVIFYQKLQIVIVICYNDYATGSHLKQRELSTMKNKDFEQFRKFYEMAEQAKSAQNEEAFAEFIRFCVERLKRGDQVQAIWNDYQETIR